MRKSRFSTEQRLAILAEHDSGLDMSSLCRKHQITAATFYKWKREQADSADEQKRRLKELEAENARLKKMYAELSIDHQILQDGYDLIKKMSAQNGSKKL
jgi:putative transposase